jgi:hypothetical protein
MEWYQYVAVFFSGAFFANAVPHFVQGVSGNKFPTPFGKPPGKGLSSAMTNVLWGLLNLILGYLLFLRAPIDSGHPVSLIIFFIGVVALSVMAAKNFPNRDKE